MYSLCFKLFARSVEKSGLCVLPPANPWHVTLDTISSLDMDNTSLIGGWIDLRGFRCRSLKSYNQSGGNLQTPVLLHTITSLSLCFCVDAKIFRNLFVDQCRRDGCCTQFKSTRDNTYASDFGLGFALQRAINGVSAPRLPS